MNINLDVNEEILWQKTGTHRFLLSLKNEHFSGKKIDPERYSVEKGWIKYDFHYIWTTKRLFVIGILADLFDVSRVPKQMYLYKLGELQIFVESNISGAFKITFRDGIWVFLNVQFQNKKVLDLTFIQLSLEEYEMLKKVLITMFKFDPEKIERNEKKAAREYAWWLSLLDFVTLILLSQLCPILFIEPLSIAKTIGAFLLLVSILGHLIFVHKKRYQEFLHPRTRKSLFKLTFISFSIYIFILILLTFANFR